MILKESSGTFYGAFYIKVQIRVFPTSPFKNAAVCFKPKIKAQSKGKTKIQTDIFGLKGTMCPLLGG